MEEQHAWLCVTVVNFGELIFQALRQVSQKDADAEEMEIQMQVKRTRMRFTSKDIKDNKPLRSFIRTKIRPRKEVFKTVVMDNFLYNVYDSKIMIRDINRLIRKHEKGTNSTKYIPRWQGYIKVLEDMDKKNV